MMRVFALTVSCVAAINDRPCDILGAAGNPCVAAHSTVRALYADYIGPLYEVVRPNNQSAIISVKSDQSTRRRVGLGVGFADGKAHEEFCAAGDCVIATVFDQSPQGNHLYPRISDGVGHGMINASKHKIFVGSYGFGLKVEVFGMWFEPGQAYHTDFTKGVAKGNDPESIYAVMSGKRFTSNCCFDYGNSENTTAQPVTAGDYACGAREAISFGNGHGQGNTGYGSGPWVGADLEAGVYYGGGNTTKMNPANKPLTTDFVTLHLKGRTDGFALKGGDANHGSLEFMYDGPRPDLQSAPNSCQPMQKQGAIILGTSGDKSNGVEGNFYEGFIATGVTSTAIDDAIQSNIVNVGYSISKKKQMVTEISV